KLDIKVTPDVIDNSYYFGISLVNESEEGIIAAFKYAIYKFTSLFEQILKTLLYLITGRLSLNALSGPIGIYKVVGEVAKEGLINILYLLGYISLNVGVVNLIPLPAFDGGRAFIMIIEGVTRKKVNQKIENTIHTIGLILLLILMLVITISDIIKIIG
ncbi:MAG: site-2 protease family protein, partial [Bacilli bacterium]|nr:site-2 protease family protein [Bacilli bacterium]